MVLVNNKKKCCVISNYNTTRLIDIEKWYKYNEKNIFDLYEIFKETINRRYKNKINFDSAILFNKFVNFIYDSSNVDYSMYKRLKHLYE